MGDHIQVYARIKKLSPEDTSDNIAQLQRGEHEVKILDGFRQHCFLFDKVRSCSLNILIFKETNIQVMGENHFQVKK